MLGFFRFVLIFILILLIIRFLFRLIFPLLIKNYLNKNGYKNNSAGNKHEGDVTIEYKNEKNKKYDKGEGEYVDFEEIDN